MTDHLQENKPVKRIDLSVNLEKTGQNLKKRIQESGYTIAEIMEITGITAKQTIYKWYKGKSLPSLEVLLILSRILRAGITELLVLEENYSEPETAEIIPVSFKMNRSRRVRAYCRAYGGQKDAGFGQQSRMKALVK